MKTRSAITFGPLTLGPIAFGPIALSLSVLLLGGAAGLGGASMAAASARDQSRGERLGRAEAARAQKALAAQKIDAAVAHAEAAVGFQPQVAAYRLLLGQSYLKGGRFASARDAFADTLTLDGSNGRAALHFALAQIATGDWAGARKTLDAHADTIPVADRGLAIALAGDPAAAVELLGTAARAPGSDAKLRQNLALALALAGRWQEAKTVVAIDVAPDQVDARIMEWATFSRPKSASDQVAALLGVTPAVDPGVPVALALNGTPRTGAPQVATADPVDAFMPGKPADPAVAQATPAEPMPAAPVALVAAAPGAGGIVFGERREVVESLPVPVAATKPPRAARAPRTAAGAVAPALAVAAREPAAPMPAANGNFYVQLGAYESAGVAHDAWHRAARRFARFGGRTPQGTTFKTAAGTFYRLSVGGFVRADAVSLCLAYRAAGGACFVRPGAGDQVALWAKGRELASR